MISMVQTAELLSGCEKSYMAVAGFVPMPVQGNQIQLHLTVAQQVEYSDMSLPLYKTGNETIRKSDVKGFSL